MNNLPFFFFKPKILERKAIQKPKINTKNSLKNQEAHTGVPDTCTLPPRERGELGHTAAFTGGHQHNTWLSYGIWADPTQSNQNTFYINNC